jgi:hypothetical protein
MKESPTLKRHTYEASANVNQGCQILYVQPGSCCYIFSFPAIWYILCTSVIFGNQMVYFLLFGILYHEKSGNPGVNACTYLLKGTFLLKMRLPIVLIWKKLTSKLPLRHIEAVQNSVPSFMYLGIYPALSTYSFTGTYSLTIMDTKKMP